MPLCPSPTPAISRAVFGMLLVRSRRCRGARTAGISPLAVTDIATATFTRSSSLRTSSLRTRRRTRVTAPTTSAPAGRASSSTCRVSQSHPPYSTTSGVFKISERWGQSPPIFPSPPSLLLPFPPPRAPPLPPFPSPLFPSPPLRSTTP